MHAKFFVCAKNLDSCNEANAKKIRLHIMNSSIERVNKHMQILQSCKQNSINYLAKYFKSKFYFNNSNLRL